MCARCSAWRCSATTGAAVNRALRDAGVQLADGVEVRIRGRVELLPAAGPAAADHDGVDPVFTVGPHGGEPGPAAADARRRGPAAGQRRARDADRCRCASGWSRRAGARRTTTSCRSWRRVGYAFRVAHCARARAGRGGRPADRRTRCGGSARLELDVVVVVRGGGARSDLARVRHRGGGPGHRGDAGARAHRASATRSTAPWPTKSRTRREDADGRGRGMLVDRVAEFDAELRHLSHRVASRARAAVARRPGGGDGRRPFRRVVTVAPRPSCAPSTPGAPGWWTSRGRDRDAAGRAGRGAGDRGRGRRATDAASDGSRPGGTGRARGAASARDADRVLTGGGPGARARSRGGCSSAATRSRATRWPRRALGGRRRRRVACWSPKSPTARSRAASPSGTTTQ